jgi:arsenite-transporting ATPase
MSAVRVYEAALCCNTGVCGPDVDQALVSFTADLAFLTDQGADIARHNLANDPMAFANDETVRAFLQVAGSEGLPLTTVDGVTVLTGAYPSREQLTRFTGSSLLMSSDDSDGASSECGPTGCC